MESAHDERQEAKSGANFWNDLYWLSAISLVFIVIGISVVIPRTVEILGLLKTERATVERHRVLETRSQTLMAATEAIQNDPVFKEGILRNRFRAKRQSEEFLVPPPTSSPITPIGSQNRR